MGAIQLGLLVLGLAILAAMAIRWGWDPVGRVTRWLAPASAAAPPIEATTDTGSPANAAVL